MIGVGLCEPIYCAHWDFGQFDLVQVLGMQT